MQHKNILILTGAGLSAESGLDTFRDKGGVWAQYDYREVATPEGFAANPDLVHAFYNMRRAALKTVTPNAAHIALGKLQNDMAAKGGRVSIVTQNVDDLHEAGGAEGVIHMHGELAKVRCVACETVTEWREDLGRNTQCPACSAVGAMRPHIVWFGEIPMEMDRIGGLLADADVFVSIGTSGSVYPAAGFVAEARQLGKTCVELNLEPSENHTLFTDARYGPATEVVPAWVQDIIA
ncbi:MAG: NAD-dependent deacylase [Pseudomonadota bacterium]